MSCPRFIFDTTYDTIYNLWHEPIKKVYVEKVKEIVESEMKNHEDD